MPEGDALDTCSCGYERDHFMISPECKYSLWGWMRVSFLGISTRPIRVEYRCRRCLTLLHISTDPLVLDELTYV